MRNCSTRRSNVEALAALTLDARKGCFGMTKEQVRAQLRHTTDETQRHCGYDDLANVRNAVTEIDFE
jgi:hypothetical protein